jgi:hypothetical protein
VVKQSEAVDVEHAIAGMPDSHLMCRDFGHSWRPHHVEHVPQRGEYIEQLVCARCRTIRTRLVSPTGHQLANSYKYPDNYLIQGLGRLDEDDRATLRLSALHSVIEQLSRKSARRGA